MICRQCKRDLPWEEMSDDSFLTICNGCDMDNMYKEEQ